MTCPHHVLCASVPFQVPVLFNQSMPHIHLYNLTTYNSLAVNNEKHNKVAWGSSSIDCFGIDILLERYRKTVSLKEFKSIRGSSPVGLSWIYFVHTLVSM